MKNLFSSLMIKSFAISFVFVSNLQAQDGSSSLVVEFPKIAGIRPGSPVVIEGNLVGRVQTISKKKSLKSSTSSERKRSSSKSYEVALSVDATVLKRLTSETFALQALPMTDSESGGKPVIELLSPKPSSGSKQLTLLRPGDKIPGYCSYEEFWRADPRKS